MIISSNIFLTKKELIKTTVSAPMRRIKRAKAYWDDPDRGAIIIKTCANITDRADCFTTAHPSH